MTPVLPTYKHYTQNLIVMTSGDANAYGEKLLRRQTIMNVFIADKNIMNLILPLTMYIPDVWEVLPILATVFPPVDDVIKKKEV